MGRNNADFQQSAWFHASSAVLNPGDKLTPGASRGVNNFPPKGDNTAVWVEPSVYRAFGWGDRAAKKRGANVHIYEVTPDTKPESAGNLGHKTTGATVVRKVTTEKAKK
jgi:hypothetical protein